MKNAVTRGSLSNLQRPVRAGAMLAAVLAAWGGMLLGGCESADKNPAGSERWHEPRPGGPPGSADAPGSGAFNAHPFDPVTMRIHPLTHLQRSQDVSGNSGDAAGGTGPRINCFVEFKDRWGDTCKALGTLEVQLYRTSNEPGQERQDARWDADLTDLQKNADWFDPVTRAYRLQLQVPEWLGDPANDGQVKLRVVYTPASSNDESRKIRAEFVVARS